jgi:hypothetical protein
VDGTPCEVEQNFTNVMKILIENFNGFYFILLSAPHRLILEHINEV